jgi:hypothetical protein
MYIFYLFDFFLFSVLEKREKIWHWDKVKKAAKPKAKKLAAKPAKKATKSPKKTKAVKPKKTPKKK